MTHSFPTRRSSDLCVVQTRRRADQFGRRRAVKIGATEVRRPLERSVLVEDDAGCDQRGPWQIIRETGGTIAIRSEEHTSELQSLMRISYAVFCLKKNSIYHESIQKNVVNIQ